MYWLSCLQDNLANDQQPIYRTPEGKDYVRDTGFVSIMDGEHEVVSNPAGEAPVCIDGALQQMFQSKNPVYKQGRDVCIDEDNN
ncbi:MAG: hypothetical protein KJN76_06970 [Eudoraea sp.]|nr:hypothetical protein [Eudoraea sp.]